MARVKNPKAAHCVWTEDEDGNWDTGCDEKHSFIDGGPKENFHRFCPYCGAPLREKKLEGVDG